MKRAIDRALMALLLIRIGQELGSDSRAARAIHAAITLIADLTAALTR